MSYWIHEYMSHLQYWEKHARPKDTYACLIVFFITNQNFILNVQHISFSKILRNTKLRWHFRIKDICHLTFIFVFEDITWLFGFKVEHQTSFVKHTHNLHASTQIFELRTFILNMFLNALMLLKIHDQNTQHKVLLNVYTCYVLCILIMNIN